MELRATKILAVALVAATLGCDGSGDDADADLGVQATIGLEFVQQRGCPMCHAPADDSAGTMAGRSTPLTGTGAYPANLTTDIATGLGGWADIEIVRAMRYGIDKRQAPLCPPMPHFDGSDPTQPAMTDVEADAIVAYLRSLPPVARAIPGSMCPPLKPPPPVDMAMVPPADLAASPVDLAEHD